MQISKLVSPSLLSGQSTYDRWVLFTKGQQSGKRFHPRYQGSRGPHGSHMGLVGPRRAPCRPHESGYQGWPDGIIYNPNGQRLTCTALELKTSRGPIKAITHGTHLLTFHFMATILRTDHFRKTIRVARHILHRTMKAIKACRKIYCSVFSKHMELCMYNICICIVYTNI